MANSRRRILVGCALFASLSLKNTPSAQTEDSKWHLLRSFLRLIIRVLPEVVSMENVAELQKHVIFHDFVDALEEDGYEVTESVVETWRYGVPQTRKRLVLLGSRLGRICLPPPTHGESRQRTVRSVIGGLERISAGETSLSDPLHRARALSSLNLKRIRKTPEGGDWTPSVGTQVVGVLESEAARKSPTRSAKLSPLAYRRLGGHSVPLWEHEIRSDTGRCVARILRAQKCWKNIMGLVPRLLAGARKIAEIRALSGAIIFNI